MFRTVRLLSLSLLSLALALPACGKSANDANKPQRSLKVRVGKGDAKSVTANVADFDPNGDFNLDLDAYGSERPDEYAVQQAFFGQFEALDACVWTEKERRSSEDQLPGDAVMAVMLNPKEARPLGVNATMPEALAKASKLTDCLREATAAAPYPTYDGPPVVVEFEFEVDPGSYEVVE